MMTYIVEDTCNNIIEYFHKLSDAKYFVITRFPGYSILSMKGNYFGEGFHKYRYYLKANGKFERHII